MTPAAGPSRIAPQVVREAPPVSSWPMFWLVLFASLLLVGLSQRPPERMGSRRVWP